MKTRKSISTYVLLSGVLGLSVVGGILFFGIYSALTKTQSTSTQLNLIKPLDNEIDMTIFEQLTDRRVFTETELSVVVTPSIAVTASGAGTLSEPDGGESQ